MTDKVLIARAWGHKSSPSALLHHAGRKSDNFDVPLLIVRGLPESELRELLERRGVCEVVKHIHDGPYEFAYICHPLEPSDYSWEDPKFCRYCGRRVVVGG